MRWAVGGIPPCFTHDRSEDCEVGLHCRLGQCLALLIGERERRVFFVLEGEVEFFLAGAEPRLARPGDFVFGRRGAPHRFEVRTPEARMPVLGTPGGGERFFEAMGEPVASATLP